MTVGKIDLCYLYNMKKEFEMGENGKMVVLQLCMDLGLIADRRECPTCGNDMTLKPTKNKDGYEWVCRVNKKDASKHRVKRSVRMNSWFESSHLSMIDVLLITEFFVRKVTNEDVMQELNVAKQTATDWRIFFREVCVEIGLNNSEKIGGIGVTVDINESKFDKRKYNRGKRFNGEWIFGGVQRKSNKCFLEVVKYRDKDTLLNLIRTWILPGTTIISDCWKSYDCLDDKGFIDYMVNHSLTLKDPEMDASTNSEDETWSAAKRELPSRKVADSLGTYLAEYIWFRHHRDTYDRMHAFLVDIAKVFWPSRYGGELPPSDSD